MGSGAWILYNINANHVRSPKCGDECALDGNGLPEKWHHKILAKECPKVSVSNVHVHCCECNRMRSPWLTEKNKLFACSAIDPEEKIGIKRTLLSESFAEPVPQIAIQMAVLIGNISRLDYPNDWDDVSHVVATLHFY